MLVTPTLHLTTFGGYALGTSDRPLGAAATQRRPLAVLALLAAAGETGVSRERLVATLWPDAEPERGRRALTQALYSLRRSTGADDLFVGVTDVRLNAAAVTCDAVEFDAALREGRLADAVALYRGPFLDGFQLPGADEFERWLDAERQRYARRCADALRELARGAARDGDGASEVAWCRRRVELDPLDSTATLALVDALGRAGDAAGAQRAAHLHATLVRDELGLGLAPAIAARVAAIIAEAARAPAALPPGSGGPGPGADDRASARGADPLDAAAASPVATHAPAREPPRPRRAIGPRAVVAAVAAAVAAAALLAVGYGVGRGAGAPTPGAAAAPGRANVVAVLPFALETPDASLAFLGQGVADLIARTLTGGVGPRAVDPATVLTALAAARAPAPARSADPLGDRAREVGRRVGAGEVLVGRVTSAAERVTLHAVLLDVATGAPHARAEVSGPADSLVQVVDGLVARLVARRDLDPDGSEAFANASLAVLRTYLRAEAAYRDDRYQDAVGLYGQALARDSSFAPAALGLAAAADRLNSAEQHDRGLALAWAARDRLGERDRAYLVALAGPRFPDPSTASEQLAAWEDVVARSPDRAEAWSELGERYFSDGTFLGMRNPDARAAAAFRRALELDPHDVSARRHLVEIAVRAGDRPRLAAIATSDTLRAVGGDLAGYLEWRVALALGDSARLARARDGLPRLGAPSLRAIAMAAQHEGVGLADGARALRHLAGRAALAAEQLDVLLAQHSLALAQRRPVLALDLTEQLQDAQPGFRAHLRLRVLDALYAEGDSAAAARAAFELARTADAPPPTEERARAVRLADACVLAQWRAAPWAPRRRADGARGELALARRAAAELRAEVPPPVPVPVGASSRACGVIVDAMAAVSAGDPDARARVGRLDALMLTGPALGDATAWATLAVARLYERLGDPRRALGAARQRPYMKGWPRYLASALQAEARLARAVGDSAAAEGRLAVLHAPPD